MLARLDSLDFALKLHRHPRTPLSLLALSTAALAASCGGETAPTKAPRPAATLTAGAFSVRVDPDAGDLSLRKSDAVLLHFPLDGLELGTVPALDDAVNYDPTTLAVANALQPPPDGLEFLTVTSIDVTTKTEKSLTITLRYPGDKQATLTVDTEADGRFRLKLSPGAAGAPIAYFRAPASTKKRASTASASPSTTSTSAGRSGRCRSRPTGSSRVITTRFTSRFRS